MDVVRFPNAVPEAEANGGPLVAVVKGTGIVRRYGAGDTAVDALIAIYSPAETHRSADILAGIADGVAISRAHGFNQKPVLLCSMTRRRRAAPLSAGDEQLPAYMFPENAVRALSKITAYAAWRHVPALHAVAH